MKDVWDGMGSKIIGVIDDVDVGCVFEICGDVVIRVFECVVVCVWINYFDVCREVG